MTKRKKDTTSRRRKEREPETNSADLLHKIEPLPGALCAQYMRCGKANCKCSKGDLHGPYFVRFWYEHGRQRKEYIKKNELLSVKAAIAARKQEEAELKDFIRNLNGASALIRKYYQIVSRWRL